MTTREILAERLNLLIMDENLTDEKLRDASESLLPNIADYFNLTDEITELKNRCYNASKDAGWHTDLSTGKLKDRNKAEMICLIHSELSEAMEGERKGLMDDHLPHRPMAEVEMADAVIRIMDYCGRWDYDISGAIKEKLEYNKNRADHKIENRSKEGGKTF